MPRRFFRRIVVAIEFPQERTQIALAKAARIARATGTRLLLFHSVYSPYATGRGLALPVVEQGIRQTIAESRRHAFGARLFLTNTDWQLIRLCPAPLLFVKQARAWRKLRVLAAVDPLHAFDKPARLDRRILELSLELARSESGSLDVVHASSPPAAYWPGAHGEPIALPVDPVAERKYLRGVRRRLERSTEFLGLPRDRLHLRTGVAHSVLPAVARQLRADVLVMGAVSRHGLDRLIVGRTAERVLDRAPCDVLVVKPRRFRTPVSRRQPL